MRAPISLSLCLLSIFWLSQAQAKSNPKALEKIAKKACAVGDFRKGVEILADLYVETNDQTYI